MIEIDLKNPNWLKYPGTEGEVIAIGFYGDKLEVGFGSFGGWSLFGPMRKVSKSDGNILYELDGKPALDLYKLYLGDKAKELPGSALLFPLTIHSDDGQNSLVPTILSLDEEKGSMTFAANIPEGSNARLMKATFDRIIDGANQAAANAALNSKDQPELALCISCVGRKLLLGERTDEEIEAIRVDLTLGKQYAITGFYSYGELAPQRKDMSCQLHNQTMTITTLREA